MSDTDNCLPLRATEDHWASPEQVVFARLCFTYLLISPSYELARKHRVGALSDADRAKLPADIDVVLGVYDMLGDVKQTVFRDWWRDRGIAAFGNEGARPMVHPIDAIWPRKAEMVERLEKGMVEYLGGRFSQQDPQACLIVAIPLLLAKSEITDQVKTLIDEMPPAFKTTPQRTPLYPLYGQKRDLSGLIRYIKCAMCKSDDPDLKLWEVGVLAGLSTTYSARLAMGKGTTEDQQSLKMLASRALNRAATIAENAARGLFPTYEKCEHAMKPDWVGMQNPFSDNEGWSDGLNEYDDL
ncbi:hypothetical protein [Sphingomonas aerolata]|uniref:hypothetical protein n=1 Tax=Sphingomonas aerolata TaxID=185951 RepID=UPI00334D069E